MSLVDAVIRTGALPPDTVTQAQKKRYSEVLSHHLAEEVAASRRAVGFPEVKPVRGGPGEKAFQGGLGPKKVDVSYADERHGLLLAVSIKSINVAPFGKNLKNRFSDLCTEAITLHMRFPYSVVCALFALPDEADSDTREGGRSQSTFQRATKLLGTIGGRREYTDPGEKFENVTTMLFGPLSDGGEPPAVRLFQAGTGEEMTENEYFAMLLDIYNSRNPHALLGDIEETADDEE